MDEGQGVRVTAFVFPASSGDAGSSIRFANRQADWKRVFCVKLLGLP